MTDVMQGAEQHSPGMGRRLHVFRNPEELTPPSELALGVLIYEDYESAEGTRIRRGVDRIGGAAIHFTDESPLDFEDPEPILYVPGFYGIKPGYSLPRHHTALRGRRAVTFKVPRSNGLSGWHPNYLFTPERLTSQAAYAMFRRLLRDPGVNEVHIAGHSMGGPISAEIADHKPGVGSVTLIGSAGLEDHSMFSLARKLPGFFAHEIAPSIPVLGRDFEVGVVKHMLEYALMNPRLTLGEIRQVTSVDARPTIKRLVSKKKPVPVYAIQMQDDHLFDEPTVHAEVARYVTRYLRVPGIHLKPQLEPEETVDAILEVVAA